MSLIRRMYYDELAHGCELDLSVLRIIEKVSRFALRGLAERPSILDFFGVSTLLNRTLDGLHSSKLDESVMLKYDIGHSILRVRYRVDATGKLRPEVDDVSATL